MAGGDSLVAHPRVCRPRNGRCRRNPGRRCAQCSGAVLDSACSSCSGAGSRGWTRHTGGCGAPVRLPAPSPTSRARISSSTATGGCCTWARPSRCGQRINSYFQDPFGLPPRTAQMVEQADHVEWMVVDTESEALLLEHNLIKRHQPRYNVRLKDDKSYPWLALTVGDEWPRPAVVRGRQAERGPLLRPVRQRVRDQGHPRPPAAHLPAADLLRRQVPAARATGAPVPPVPHRPLLGPVRRRGRPRGVRPDGGRSHLVPERGHRTARARTRDVHARGVGRARVRAGLGAAGQARGGPGRRRGPPDGARPPGGPRRGRPRRGRARGGRPGVPRPLGKGRRADGACSSTRSRT